MTARVQRDLAFMAGVYCEDQFSMCLYDVSLCIDIETNSIREQNIAMERISFFLSEHLNSCIFINEINKKMIDTYTNAGFKVCTVPEEPHDQIISLMLLLKLNAITEDRFVVTDISLTSSSGDGVSYLCNADEPIGPFEKSGWWSKSDASISPTTKLNKKEKIVQLFKTPHSDWSEFGLGWKEKEISLSVSPEISFDKLPE